MHKAITKLFDITIPYFKIGRIMAEAQETTFNMDALLDGTLDDLADLPAFEPYRAGTHVVQINIEGPVAVNKHPSFKLKMKLIETKELADPNETAQAPGTEAEVLYPMDNEYGQGGFKKILAGLNETFQKKTNREIIEAAQGAECIVITTIRSNKDKTAFYTAIKDIGVV